MKREESVGEHPDWLGMASPPESRRRYTLVAGYLLIWVFVVLMGLTSLNFLIKGEWPAYPLLVFGVLAAWIPRRMLQLLTEAPRGLGPVASMVVSLVFLFGCAWLAWKKFVAGAPWHDFLGVGVVTACLLVYLLSRFWKRTYDTI